MPDSSYPGSRPSVPGGADVPLLIGLVAVTGVAVGAGIFESRVVIPRWAGCWTSEQVRVALEESGHLASGEAFWPLVGAPVVPLTVLNLYRALRSSGPRRPWWIAFASTIAVGCVATAAYFVPELHRLAATDAIPPERVRAAVIRRVRLDNVRLVVLVLAWLAGLRALSLPAEEPVR